MKGIISFPYTDDIFNFISHMVQMKVDPHRA